MTQWNLLQLDSVPIYEQLQLEEALLRVDDGNWILTNRGAPPAIVMGISGKAEELIHLDKVYIPVIRRFSGGGTVVVDHNTLFVTIICQHEDLPCAPYPKELMLWTAERYQKVFGGDDFSLRENDYCIGEKKCAGNAQSLVRGRCLHHTTWLWDYDPERMQLLTNPPKQPEYRQRREHRDFLTTISHRFSDPSDFLSATIEAFTENGPLLECGIGDLEALKMRPHRQATRSESLTV